MIKLIGAVMITMAAGFIGFAKVKSLKEHVRTLNAMISAMEVMRAEILFRLTPLPEIFSKLSGESEPPACYLFQNVSMRLNTGGGKPFGEIWNESLADTPELLLADEEMTVLSDLGSVLGRYDPEQQAKAIGLAESRFDRLLKRAEVEKATQSRMFGALGLILGICIVIVLV